MRRADWTAVLLAAVLLCLSACGGASPPAARHSVTPVAQSPQTEVSLSVLSGAGAPPAAEHP